MLVASLSYKVPIRPTIVMCDYLFQYIILNDNFLTELYVYTQTDLILSSWPITE